MKTEGELNRRARAVALWMWPVQLVLTVAGLLATIYIRPTALDNYKQHFLGFLIPALVYAALALMIYAIRKGSDRRMEKIAFVGSALYIVGMLAGAAFALYPVVLPASTDPARSLTVGITWWILGMILALGYFTVLFRMFKGKVQAGGEGY